MPAAVSDLIDNSMGDGICPGPTDTSGRLQSLAQPSRGRIVEPLTACSGILPQAQDE